MVFVLGDTYYVKMLFGMVQVVLVSEVNREKNNQKKKGGKKIVIFQMIWFIFKGV